MSPHAPKPDALFTYSEAGRRLGVNYKTVSELVRCLDLAPKIVPWNGLAKGLDEADLESLRRALSPARGASSA